MHKVLYRTNYLQTLRIYPTITT